MCVLDVLKVYDYQNARTFLNINKTLKLLSKFYRHVLMVCSTGKSVSEALILESVNPKYDNRLFIDLQLLTQKNTNSEHVVYKNCFECQNKNKKQFLYTTCSELVFFWVRSRKSMNNLLSYFGLTDARMNASEKDLPVQVTDNITDNKQINLCYKGLFINH